MKSSDIERQTSAFPKHGIKIFSCCTVDLGFFILTFSIILVESKIRFSDPDFIQSVKIVFTLSNELDSFYNKFVEFLSRS